MKNNVFVYTGTGKLGNFVGYAAIGKMVWRAYQGVVRNPRTAPQLLQRAKFKALLEASRMFVGAYRMGLKDEARSRKRTPFSQFMAINAAAVTGTTPENVTVQNNELVCATGVIPSMGLDVDHIDQTSVPGTISVAVQERNTDSFLADDKDMFYLVATCPEVKEGCIGSGEERGEATELAVTPPSSWNGKKVYIYAFGLGTQGENYGKSSNSTYVGSADFVIE